jgi:hypothetical protein
MFRLEYHARITRRLVGLTGDDSLRRDADAGGALLEVVDDLERGQLARGVARAHVIVIGALALGTVGVDGASAAVSGVTCRCGRVFENGEGAVDLAGLLVAGEDDRTRQAPRITVHVSIRPTYPTGRGP